MPFPAIARASSWNRADWCRFSASVRGWWARKSPISLPSSHRWWSLPGILGWRMPAPIPPPTALPAFPTRWFCRLSWVSCFPPSAAWWTIRSAGAMRWCSVRRCWPCFWHRWCSASGPWRSRPCLSSSGRTGPMPGPFSACSPCRRPFWRRAAPSSRIWREQVTAACCSGRRRSAPSSPPSRSGLPRFMAPWSTRWFGSASSMR